MYWVAQNSTGLRMLQHLLIELLQDEKSVAIGDVVMLDQSVPAFA